MGRAANVELLERSILSEEALGLVGRRVLFFDVHVLEFAGVEDLAAFETLYELGIFVASDDLDTRVLARLIGFALGRIRRL